MEKGAKKDYFLQGRWAVLPTRSKGRRNPEVRGVRGEDTLTAREDGGHSEAKLLPPQS